MISAMQRKRTNPAHMGTVTVLIALWFSMFCNHCLAVAGDLPEPDNKPGEHCPHGHGSPVSDPPVDDRKAGACEGVCESTQVTVTSLPKHTDGAFVVSLSAEDSATAGPLSQHGAVGAWQRSPISSHDTPERAYFPPFQRYTVLLN